MNCISHSDIDAVGICARCGSGLCQECVNSTYYQIDNKPLCKKCNYEVGCENDGIFKSVLRSRLIKLIIFIVTFVIGLTVFIVNKTNGSETASAVIGMLFIWGLGFIGNFFEKQAPDARSVKAQTKDALLEVKHPVSTLIGKILGFFIMAVTSPLQILFLLIGINKIKKQIAQNRTVINSINSQGSAD
ncbi:MAG: hypothetical protein LBC77_05870 [Spirochaetaceae bacterium]|jgi:hypothetical protein|nr:hypothetical protein [Spirochaetaceae bacterium]